MGLLWQKKRDGSLRWIWGQRRKRLLAEETNDKAGKVANETEEGISPSRQGSVKQSEEGNGRRGEVEREKKGRPVYVAIKFPSVWRGGRKTASGTKGQRVGEICPKKGRGNKESPLVFRTRIAVLRAKEAQQTARAAGRELGAAQAVRTSKQAPNNNPGRKGRGWGSTVPFRFREKGAGWKGRRWGKTEPVSPYHCEE